MDCGRILSYLLYGSVASLPSPSSNIEAWPYGTSLRFAPAFRALGVCEHIWLRYKNFDPSCFDPIKKFGWSTWGPTPIFYPVPSTYFRPPGKKVFILGLVAPEGRNFQFSAILSDLHVQTRKLFHNLSLIRLLFILMTLWILKMHK